MKYNFKEKELSADFSVNLTSEVTRQLTPAGLFTLSGMSGVGISFFIRFLVSQKLDKSIYIDILSLSTPTKAAVYEALLKELGGNVAGNTDVLEACKKRLEIVLKEENHITIIFNRFDELGKEIDKQFLGSLRTLRHGAADKVSMIFVTHSSMVKLFPEAVANANLDLFSNIVWFSPFSKDDLLALITLHSPELVTDPEVFTSAYIASGGHYQLCKLFLKSSYKTSPLQDPTILYSLQSLYEGFSYSQKKQLQRIVQKKGIKNIDPDLLNLKAVIFTNDSYTLFSPLLEEYIKKFSRLKLPVKEAIIFKLLKQARGKVVSKEELFRSLWSEDAEEFGSDWALNSLIYRLRKNPTFISQGYVIENYKKVGYTLLKD